MNDSINILSANISVAKGKRAGHVFFTSRVSLKC